MDSITQAALGAAVAAVVAGKQCRPKTLLAGALLGTLPDLDVFIRYGDPISNMVNHRGFSHSLLVLFPFSLLLTALYTRYARNVSLSFMRLWLLIALALMTHPLLDSLTTYGTQLFWPFDAIIKISSISIIDPLYTIPLLMMIMASLLWRDKMAKLCGIGLIISSCYLVWSGIALHQITERVMSTLKDTALYDKPILISPTTFNTLLWRIVIIDGETYYEGLASLLDSKVNGKYEIKLIAREKGKLLLKNKSSYIHMLEWFSGQFIRYEQIDNTLVATDLRMGMGKYFHFSFAVANLDDKDGKDNKDEKNGKDEKDEKNQWQGIKPVNFPTKNGRHTQLNFIWQRMLGDKNIDAKLLN